MEMDQLSNQSVDRLQQHHNIDMENRMTMLENWKEAMQVEMVVRLMEQVCNRINMNPA